MIDISLLINMIIDILTFLAIYLVLAVSLNLQYGYAGIPNFGLALSAAGGAYVTGALTGRIAMTIYGVGEGLDFMTDNTKITELINARLIHDPLMGIMIFVLIIAIATVINAGLGYIASRPAIKLRADYLMMTLIAMAEAARVIGINYYPLVGGTFWVHVPDLFAWMGDMKRVGVCLIIFAIAIIVFLAAQFMVTSPYGRLLRAVRDNEVTAECVGKDVVKIRTKVIIIGSIIASLAGVLYAFHLQTVLATAFKRTDWTFWPWLMVMVGGPSNNIGAAVGTLVVILTRRMIIYYKHYFEAYVPFEVIWLEQIMLGLALILIMVFRPQGLIPEKPTRIRGLTKKTTPETKRGKEGIIVTSDT